MKHNLQKLTNQSNVLILSPSRKISQYISIHLIKEKNIGATILPTRKIDKDFIFKATNGKCLLKQQKTTIDAIQTQIIICNLLLKNEKAKFWTFDSRAKYAKSFLEIFHAMIDSGVDFSFFEKRLEETNHSLVAKWLKSAEIFKFLHNEFTNFKKNNNLQTKNEQNAEALNFFSSNISYITKYKHIYLVYPFEKTAAQKSLKNSITKNGGTIINFEKPNNLEQNYTIFDATTELSRASIIQNLIITKLNQGLNKIAVITDSNEIAKNLRDFFSSKNVPICDAFGYKMEDNQFYMLFILFLKKLFCSANLSSAQHLSFAKSIFTNFDKNEILTQELLVRKGKLSSDYFEKYTQPKIDHIFENFSKSITFLFESFTSELNFDSQKEDKHFIELEKFTSELSKAKLCDECRDFETFLEMLEHFAKQRNYRLQDVINDEKVLFLLSPLDAVGLFFDVTFLVSIEQKTLSKNLIFSQNLQKFFGLLQDETKTKLIEFQSLLYSAKEVLLCNIGEYLNFFKSLNLTYKTISFVTTKQQIQQEIPSIQVSSTHIPKVIYATQIEKLMQNPYDFYIDQILQIKQLQPLNPEKKESDLGTEIHSIIDKMIKNITAEKAFDFKKEIIQEIAKKGFDKFLSYNFHSVQILFENIQKWLLDCMSKQYELKSEEVIVRNFCDEKITLRAKADLIIYAKNTNSGFVIDFKTGKSSSFDLKNILSGRKSQLFLEMLILQHLKPGYNFTPEYHFLELGTGIIHRNPAIKQDLISDAFDKCKKSFQIICDFLLNNPTFQYNIESEYLNHRHFARI